jgi:hypothetical protein
MTSPIREVEVVCPDCGVEFRDTYRPSVNVSLGEDWTQEDLDAATTVRCPACDWNGEPETLIVGKAR